MSEEIKKEKWGIMAYTNQGANDVDDNFARTMFEVVILRS